MTDLETTLRRLEELRAKATGGEWESRGCVISKNQFGDCVLTVAECASEKIADYVAALHNENPAAIIRDLQARERKLRELLKRLREWDHLDMAGDGDYWKREIDAALEEK